MRLYRRSYESVVKYIPLYRRRREGVVKYVGLYLRSYESVVKYIGLYRWRRERFVKYVGLRILDMTLLNSGRENGQCLHDHSHDDGRRIAL